MPSPRGVFGSCNAISTIPTDSRMPTLRRSLQSRAPAPAPVTGEARRRARNTLASFTLLAALAAPLAAQQGTVGGVVVSAASGAPVPGTQVFVAGTATGTTTDANGRFRIGGL